MTALSRAYLYAALGVLGLATCVARSERGPLLVTGSGGEAGEGMGGNDGTGDAGDGDGGTDASGGDGGSSADGGGGSDPSGGTSGADGGGGSGARSGSGGSSSGVGGSDLTGGSAGFGGGNTGGSGGDGGSGGSGGAPSAGCGRPGIADGVQSIEVQATTRDFIVKLPASYDPNHPHPLVLGFHPNSSSAGDVAGAPLLGGYYGLEDLASADGVDVVFIAPEGIDGGWANTGGRDVAFVEQMLDALAAELCIDESRIFSVGFSYGAIMSYSLACAMGDRIRAIAAMSGGLLGGCVDGDVPVAVWSSHGTSDQTLSLSSGEAARDEFVVRNGCGSQTMATTPSPCVSHQGCDPGYPVTWCEFNGDHVTPSWAPQAIWDFFLQF